MMTAPKRPCASTRYGRLKSDTPRKSQIRVNWARLKSYDSPPPRSGKQEAGQQHSQGKRRGHREKPTSFQDTVPMVLHILRSYQA